MFSGNNKLSAPGFRFFSAEPTKFQQRTPVQAGNTDFISWFGWS